MKRCSQCHFTFEDYEQLCDFDGTELTPYPESIPFSQNASAPPAGSQSRFVRLVRSRVSLAIVALVGVMLSALLIGYYDAVSQVNGDKPGNAEGQDAVVSLVPPTGAPAQPPAHIGSRDTFSSQPEITAAKTSSPIVRRATKVSRSRARVRSSSLIRKQTRAFENASLKKESKATAVFKKSGSILKKALSILMKPFEL